MDWYLVAKRLGLEYEAPIRYVVRRNVVDGEEREEVEEEEVGWRSDGR